MMILPSLTPAEQQRVRKLEDAGFQVIPAGKGWRIYGNGQDVLFATLRSAAREMLEGGT